MSTQIYGSSDDNVCFDGDVSGEVGCYGTDDRPHGVLVVCSDGTILHVKYGKMDAAIWGVELVAQGSLFLRIEPCLDADAARYSDTAHLADGLKWAYAATTWERVK